MTREYPRLAPGIIDNLKIVQARMNKDPEFLTAPECPYEPLIVQWLRNNLGQKTPEVVDVAAAVQDDWDEKNPEAWSDTAQKSRELYRKLEELLDTTTDTGETLNIIKAQTSQLERLVTIGDKALGHKKTAEFFQIMHTIMDDVLTPDQRTKIIELMGDF